MNEQTSVRAHHFRRSLNLWASKLLGLIFALIAAYGLWAVVGWHACLSTTVFDEHTRVTQACMDTWMTPFSFPAELVSRALTH